MQAHRQAKGERWTWGDQWEDVEARFFGRADVSPSTNDLEWLSEDIPADFQIARARQVHSATVLEARPGWVGDGDALVSARSDLVLTVVTADCVPVLLASRHQISAVHAGWRGLVGKILAATVQRLADDEVVAWIGPSIGRCCYEVGDDVAKQIVAVSDASVVDRRSPRPYVDLVAAATWQLENQGVRLLRAVPQCTQCETTSLWSFRREGGAAGRNVAAIWRSGTGSERA